MDNILKDNNIKLHNAINDFIDDYLNGKTSNNLKDVNNIIRKDDFEEFFNKKNKTLTDLKNDLKIAKIFNQFLKNINYTNNHLFNDENEYKTYIKDRLKIIINDRLAIEHDKKLKEQLMNDDFKLFSDFFNKNEKIDEIKIPTMKLSEILTNVPPVNINLKKILVTFFKTYEEYIDIVDKNNHIFKIHDMSGDIMSNNKVSFETLIFNESDMLIIKENIVDYSIGEFYSALPNNINVFGIDIKPSTFVDKKEIKYIFENAIKVEDIITVLSTILNYKFESKFNDFYIWSNKK